MSEFIEVLSPSALKDLQALNSEIVKTIAGVKEVNSNMISIKTPSGSDSAIKKLTADYDAQAVKIAKLQIELEKYTQAQNKTTISNNNVILSNNRVEASIERKNKALDREQAKLLASQNLYNKVQAKLNILSAEYKNLAVQKELSGKLTDSEAKRYEFLSAKIQKYDATLKAVDASMGKYQRNVGNYASGFSPLNNSINQLTREMPAFANSVQTGFMAISNNLPIFFDAITQTKNELAALKAQGQQVPSLFKSITNSFLTWGTAMSVGVTLLTVFGDEIVDAIFNTKAKAKADEKAKEAIEKKNKAEQDYLDTMRDTASQEISNAKILFENARNQNIPLADRKKYIEDLRKAYPDYLKNLSDQDILAGKTADTEERLNDALLKRGIAIALQDKISEAYKKVADAMIVINEAEINKASIDEKSIKAQMALGMTRQEAIKSINLLNDLGIRKAEQDKKNAQEEIDNLLKLYNNYSQYLDAKRTGDKGATEDKREEIEAIKMLNIEYGGLLPKIIALRDAFTKQRDEASKGTQEYKMLNDQVIYYQKLIDEFTNTNALADSAKAGSDEFLRLNRNMADTSDKTKELTDGMKDFLKQFSEGFFSNAGLPTLFKALNDEIEGFGTNWQVTFTAMAEITQEAFNFMAEASNAHFANEYANLERQRDIAIMFAGESASAREEIERQYEARQKEIKNREFQAKKKQAMFNIVLDTAQAIVAALPNIPLSVAVGVIGAVQLALVSSQQAPAYWQGTDNHIGGDMIINDQKGSNYKEIVETPDGKKKIYDGRNVKVNAPKGTKVYTASETMDYLMFNNDLNNILTGNNISSPKVELNNTIDFTPVINAINNKETSNVSIDRNGIKEYVNYGRQTIERMNNRVEFKGKSV